MYFVLPWIVVFHGLFSGLCSHYAKSPQHQVKTHGCPSYTTSLLLFLVGNLSPHSSTFSLPPTWFGINEWDDQWVSCDKWKPSNLTRAKLRTPIFFTKHFAFLLISLSWWHHQMLTSWTKDILVISFPTSSFTFCSPETRLTLLFCIFTDATQILVVIISYQHYGIGTVYVFRLFPSLFVI